jgi:hypothetical protein
MIRYRTVISSFAAVAIVAVVAILAAWIVIPDVSVEPEVDRFAALPAFPPKSDNAFFMIWGLSASPDQDPYAVGQQIVQTHNRLLAQQKSLSNFEPTALYGPAPLTFPKDAPRLCDPVKQDCLVTYRKTRAAIEVELKDRQLYLSRYRHLRDFSNTENAEARSNAGTPIPLFRNIQRLSDLVDASVAIRTADASTESAALQDLASDMAFWRKVLSSNDWLVTQVVAARLLSRKYSLASELLSDDPALAQRYPELMKQITQPIALDQATIQAGVLQEARNTLGTIDAMRDGELPVDDPIMKRLVKSDLAMHLLFRQNATINAEYHLFQTIYQQMALSPKVLLDNRSERLAALKKTLAIGPSALFFNPFGRYVLSENYMDYTGYALRLDDLVALSRMVELQRRAILAKSSAAELPALLDRSPTLYDPYTEQPFAFDAATTTLSFQPHGERFEGRSGAKLSTGA